MATKAEKRALTELLELMQKRMKHDALIGVITVGFDDFSDIKREDLKSKVSLKQIKRMQELFELAKSKVSLKQIKRMQELFELASAEKKATTQPTPVKSGRDSTNDDDEM